MAIRVLPKHAADIVAEMLDASSSKAATHEQLMLKEMFASARDRYLELQESVGMSEFTPASGVHSQTSYGFRVFWEILLCSETELCRLTGKSVKMLPAKPIDVQLEADNNSKLYPVSMQGLEASQICGIKRMQMWRDLSVNHVENFLQPSQQLTASQGEDNFDFFVGKHFEARPAPAKLAGKPYVISSLIAEADAKEAKSFAANAAQAAETMKANAEQKKKKGKKEKKDGDDGSGSSSSGSGSSGEGEGSDEDDAKPAASKRRAAPTLGLGSLARLTVKKSAKSAAKAKLARGKSPSPARPPSSSAVAKKPQTGSKKDREIAAQLEQLEAKDAEMHKVAKEHVRDAKGTSIACLLQLNVKHFLTTPKQGQLLNGVWCLQIAELSSLCVESVLLSRSSA